MQCSRFNHADVSRAQKISTVVDLAADTYDLSVSRAQKISTVVDSVRVASISRVSRAQKISTVVDYYEHSTNDKFHALKKFLLL